MQCPACGAAELIRDTRDITYIVKGETHVVPAVTADFCSACGEVITDMSETQRVMRAIRSLGNESDSSANTTADLQNVKMIDAINADNIHEEVNFGSPVGKEKL